VSLPKTNALLNLIGRLTPAKVTTWAKGGSGGAYGEDIRQNAEDIFDANVVGSTRTDGNGVEKHAVLIDLDVPAWLIPSSTAGHSHLYIDVKAGRSAYFRLLDALAECHVIEKGYAEASKRRGASFLRLPWIKKPEVTLPGDPLDFD